MQSRLRRKTPTVCPQRRPEAQALDHHLLPPEGFRARCPWLPKSAPRASASRTETIGQKRGGRGYFEISIASAIDVFDLAVGSSFFFAARPQQKYPSRSIPFRSVPFSFGFRSVLFGFVPFFFSLLFCSVLFRTVPVCSFPLCLVSSRSVPFPFVSVHFVPFLLCFDSTSGWG